MVQRLLCEDGIRVTMDGGGKRTLIVVSDGGTSRFWTDTEVLEDILTGGRVELSAYLGSCVLEVEGDRAILEYRMEGASAKRCAFSRQELASALVWVRSLPTPDEGAPT